MPRFDYERDASKIYQKSFATIRREADLSRFSGLDERIAVRLIHTSGCVDLAADIALSPGFSRAARAALCAGAPILCDAKMIASGVTRSRLPAGNEVCCLLDDPRVPARARELGTTRSAAALSLFGPRLAGAVVAIGNAPTALFQLLEMLDTMREGARPAAIIGVPVGFVGAAESKAALELEARVPHLVVRGRRGGSAMAVAALNAIGSDEEC